MEQFETETGIDVEVRYGDSAEFAAILVLEGDASPADVFLAQDPASLGLVTLNDLFTGLPSSITERVPDRFSDPTNTWVGISGRARTVVINPATLNGPLPESIWDLTKPEYAGIGIAPSNGSFLAFVASMILTEGEAKTQEWLEASPAIALTSSKSLFSISSIISSISSLLTSEKLLTKFKGF